LKNQKSADLSSSIFYFIFIYIFIFSAGDIADQNLLIFYVQYNYYSLTDSILSVQNSTDLEFQYLITIANEDKTGRPLYGSFQ